MARILFVLGGLDMGGVETYTVRLAEELNSQCHEVDVILISRKIDPQLLATLSRYARVYIHEKVGFLAASSWINAFLPCKNAGDKFYDIIHVVDLLTLGFVYLNRDALKFSFLSIGVYHSREISWWRDRRCYFRERLIALYDKNVKLTLFPSESIVQLASQLTGTPLEDVQILPLGIKLEAYRNVAPSQVSLKIISIGRLVDFKTYNRNFIIALRDLRKVARFEYFIYGDGPERSALQNLASSLGVSEYVHFEGEIEYRKLPEVLNGCFCFVGSGTTIIEASAAGVPSIVGIESIDKPVTSGFFADVEGFSYNEGYATSTRVPIYDVVCGLYQMSDGDYKRCSQRHRLKASQFNISATAAKFVELSRATPDFDIRFNRWRALASFFYSLLRHGPEALRSRFDN